MFLTLVGTFLLSIPTNAQTKTDMNNGYLYTRPKLVLGIVVDQMRYDYLPRFWGKYGEGGFKRLVNEGFNCKNHQFNYVPTATAPGHASIYTGTTPRFHGIIGNDWYDKDLDKGVYCTQDDDVTPVGTENSAGKMSPHRELTTTVTDELRIATQGRGKVIGISLKDRASILPAGHVANAAYWFYGADEGKWITSSYYMEKLPKWVSDFNRSKKAKEYIKTWEPLYNLDTYEESNPDLNNFEGKFKGEEKAVFPHELKKIWKQNGGFSILKSVPYGNSLTVDFALAALDGEQLGKDDITDFLAVSFSATDYVGHQFGVGSKELEDTYLRLDMDLERLFKALDQKVGKGNYTVFLTADHGATPEHLYLESLNIPGGELNIMGASTHINEFLTKEYNTDKLIKKNFYGQIFLDHNLIDKMNLELGEVERKIAKELLKQEGIFEVYTGEDLKFRDYTQPLPSQLQRGYNHKRSGDIVIVMDPAGTITMPGFPKEGSMHGGPWMYDTHAPLLFFGKGIRKGSTLERTEVTDIAPTISALLGIPFPSGTTGNPIEKVLQQSPSDVSSE